MRIAFVLFMFIFLFLNSQTSQACESCAIAYLGKKEKSHDDKHIFDAKVFFENQNWDEISAREAHELHHQGHHAHDKQDEQIIHTILTAHVNDRFNVEVNIPYVTRHFIEIDSHAHLGENQTSNGLGDVTVIGDYRLIHDEEQSFGILAGVKTPTGKTDEHTSFGSLIEAELQPGTGSTDYLAGFSGSLHPGSADFSASTVYVYKTEGEQDFRFGNLLSVSLYAGKNFELKEKLQLKTGVMVNNQLEQKQNNDDGDIKDSGGYTMLIGPQLGFQYGAVELDFSYLAPAVQELGGVHQELGGIWTGALSVKF